MYNQSTQVCLSTQVLQSTMFYDRDFLTFASPVPPDSPRFLSLLRPFTLNMWIMVGIFMAAMGVAFFLISNIEVGNVFQIQMLNKLKFF